MLTAQQLVDRLITAEIAAPDEIVGCTEEDLRAVALISPGPLPSGYLSFLRALGRGAGRFLGGQDVFYPRLLDLTDRAKDILDNWEEGRLPLPAQAFVCSMRYGDQFLFFYADGQSDNPQLHHYYIERGFFRPATSFWNWIEEELRLAEQVRALR
jgi:hypothetical protein